jgi:hypothetical protein
MFDDPTADPYRRPYGSPSCIFAILYHLALQAPIQREMATDNPKTWSFSFI